MNLILHCYLFTKPYKTKLNHIKLLTHMVLWNRAHRDNNPRLTHRKFTWIFFSKNISQYIYINEYRSVWAARRGFEIKSSPFFRTTELSSLRGKTGRIPKSISQLLARNLHRGTPEGIRASFFYDGGFFRRIPVYVYISVFPSRLKRCPTSKRYRRLFGWANQSVKNHCRKIERRTSHRNRKFYLCFDTSQIHNANRALCFSLFRVRRSAIFVEEDGSAKISELSMADFFPTFWRLRKIIMTNEGKIRSGTTSTRLILKYRNVPAARI